MTTRTIALLLALLGGLPQLGEAQRRPEPHVFTDAPAARWISHPTAPREAYGVFHFRRTFELVSRPEHFVVHVSADNRYRLFVNGQQVSSGPQRSDLMHWRYETVDLAPHLRPGRNVLAALVWNWGPYRPAAQFSRHTAFLLQGDSEREAAVNSGPEWKVLPNRGLRTHPRRAAHVLRIASGGVGGREPVPLGLAGARLRRRRLASRGGRARVRQRADRASRHRLHRPGRRLAARSALHPSDGGESRALRSRPPHERPRRERGVPQARGRSRGARTLPRPPPARPGSPHERLRGAGDEWRQGQHDQLDLCGGAQGQRRAQGQPQRDRRQDDRRCEGCVPPGWRRAQELPDALVPNLSLRGAGGRDRGRAAAHPRSARHLHGLPVRAARALRERPGLACRPVGDGLARRPALRMGNLFRHSLLRAAPVHRRHAGAGPHLPLHERRRSTGAGGDPPLRPLADSGGDHRQPLSFGPRPVHPDLLADLDCDGPRLLDAPRRPRRSSGACCPACGA